MALKYDTHEQAQMRLQNSVITVDEKAAWVREVYMDNGVPHLLLQMYPIRKNDGGPAKAAEKDFVRIKADDPSLNFRVFRLGYVNDTVNRQALYCTRTPRRQQAQGLLRNNLDNIGEHAFWSQAFEDTLFGRYPSPETAYEWLTKNTGAWTSVGIARDFSVGRDLEFPNLMKLYYRDLGIGVSLSKSKFQLSPEFSFLKEVTEENNIPFDLV